MNNEKGRCGAPFCVSDESAASVVSEDEAGDGLQRLVFDLAYALSRETVIPGNFLEGLDVFGEAAASEDVSGSGIEFVHGLANETRASFIDIV